MAAFIREQVREIDSDPALRYYGAALALVNVVTAVYWLTDGHLLLVLDPQVAPICWPFESSCPRWSFLTPVVIGHLIQAFLIAAIVNAWLFLRPRSTRYAYSVLVGLSVVKAMFLFQDYRLILNQHYMAYWMTIPFLFASAKRDTLRSLVVLFYLWAGALKITPDWISGAALYGRHPLGLPDSLIPASCVYVIGLELFIVLGVLSRRTWIFWGAFAQLVLFHVASFWVVGFFYPLLMFLLLSILPLARYTARTGIRNEADVGAPSAAEQGGVWRCGSYAVCGAFCLLQLVPRAFPGDPAITGEGRMFALHMFDAPVRCEASAVLHETGGAARQVTFRVPFLTPRLMCDPLVYFEAARDYCNRRGPGGLGDDLDLVLRSRKESEASLRTVVSLPAVCATQPSYSLWRHNSWIHP